MRTRTRPANGLALPAAPAPRSPGTARTSSAARTAVAELAGGEAWNEVVSRSPEDVRHLAVHQGHCVELNEADQAAWDAGGHTLLESSTLSGTAKQVHDKLVEMADAGVTEIVFQPCGPDVRRELETFLAAAQP